LFNPQQRQPDWRRAQGIADQEVVIGFVGRIVLEKGLDVFASAVAQLESRGLKTRALIVGDGPARNWFEQRLPNARFTGFLQGQALATAYANMDIFFNPSITETFGNVTLEAMASGLPTVCANATGSRSLVAHGVSGLLVAPGDITAYADALTLYTTDSVARRHAGNAGLSRAQAYDWNKILNQVLNNYHDALVARRQPLAKALPAECDPSAPRSWSSSRLRHVA
jgi:glycosyltransferase involved in cell wall biosynthesis